jgi:hypothetical protein
MTKSKPILVCLAALLSSALAASASQIYVVTSNLQFGTADLTTGAFHQIGPDTPEPQYGLVGGPSGSLLSLTASGTLESINPATGVTTPIGSTGMPSVSTFGQLNGALFGLDYNNVLYSINAVTGASQPIGATGMPVPSDPTAFLCTALFSSGGNLYATSDAFDLDPSTLATTTVIPAALYQLDPLTGVILHSTQLSPDGLNQLLAAATVDGQAYSFQGFITSLGPDGFPDGGYDKVLNLDLSSGHATPGVAFDPAMGAIFGAVATPEPGSIVLAAFGLIACAGLKFRRRRDFAPGFTGARRRAATENIR